MASILDGLGLEGSILDGLADWPASTTRKEWFRLTRELVQKTIADMDLDPAAMAEVEEAFIGAGLLCCSATAINSKNRCRRFLPSAVCLVALGLTPFCRNQL